MKLWIEETSIAEHYWFDRQETKQPMNDISYIKSINLVADMAFTKEDKEMFVDFIGEKVTEIFFPLSSEAYKCYLVCRKVLLNPNSKVENYKKLWKHMEQEHNLKNYKLGVEIKIDDTKNVYYCGTIEMKLEHIGVAIEMLSSNASIFALYISKNNNNLNRENLEIIAPIAYAHFKKAGMTTTQLCSYLIQKGDIYVRWANDSVGLECDFIYNSNHIKL